MKKMRRLIPAIAMLLVSAVMLSTASFAWFTISSKAEVTGMSVAATASSSLLITDAADKFTSAVGTIDISKQNSANKLVPATHEDNYGDNNLKAVKDAATVNPSTGAYSGEYQAATVGNNYVEYTVFLGTTGTALEDQILNAKVAITDELAYKLHRAVTIDFYVNGVYGGKINLDQVVKTGTAFDIDIATKLTIPAAVEIDMGDEDTEGTGNAVLTGKYVTIKMLVYFDGALLDTTTEVADDCYVRNAMSTTEGVGFTVNFTAGKTATTTADPNAPATGN